MKETRSAIWLVIIVFGMNVVSIGYGPLAGTEGHRAITGHQILEGGHWAVPHLYGHPFLTKPPLYYWTLAAVEWLSGQQSEALWRLPSVLCTVALALVIWAFTRRWFGSVAALCSGLAFITLRPLWEQARTADIDAMNTLFAVTAALLYVELGFGHSKRRGLLAAATWLTLTLMLMTKGPAGLPVVAGVLIGGSAATRQWAWLKRASTWLPLLLATACFLAWFIPFGTQSTEGTSELARRLTPTWSKLQLLITMPLLLVACSLPASLVAAFGLRSTESPIQRALAGAVIAGMLLCGVALLEEIRYGFVVLPLLCPLTGAILAQWQNQSSLRRLLMLCALLLALSQVILLVQLKTLHPAMALLIAPLALTLAFAKRQQMTPAILGFIAMTLMTSVLVDLVRLPKRYARSGYVTALDLKEALPVGSTVRAAEVMSAQPELFYYSGISLLRPNRIDMDRAAIEEALQDDLPLLLHPKEWQNWHELLSEHIQSVQRLGGRDRPYLVHLKPARQQA